MFSYVSRRSRTIAVLLLSLFIFVVPACSGASSSAQGKNEAQPKKQDVATKSSSSGKTSGKTNGKTSTSETTSGDGSLEKASGSNTTQDKTQATQEPVQGNGKPKAAPKYRDFYSKGDPKTPKSLVPENSTAGAIPPVQPFNFGRDPGGPDDKTMYVSIPKIGLKDVPVYNSTSEEDLTKSTVHVPATGFPWQKGANTFIAGHRLGYPNTGSYYIFFRLNELKNGDEIIVTNSAGKSFTYRVFKEVVVSPANVDIMNPVKDKSVVSLQTCTLPDYVDRLIVQGELVDKSA